MPQVHPEAYTALVTERSDALAILRSRLDSDGRLTYDADLLLNALQQAVDAAHEYKQRLNEVSRSLRDHARGLDDAARQAEAMRHVLERGGTYRMAAERDATDKLWPQSDPTLAPVLREDVDEETSR